MNDRKKESSGSFKYNKDDIIRDCLGKNLIEGSPLHNMLSLILNAAEREENLSIDLIKNLHAKCSALVTRDIRIPPDLNRINENKPGMFRDHIVGTSPAETLTQGGISEILGIIHKEKEAKFPLYQGTWIGPLDYEVNTLSFKKSIHHGNITQKADACPDKNLAKKLYDDSKKDSFVVLFPRTNNTKLSIRKYVEEALSVLMVQFNKDIQSTKNKEEKIKIITLFIKQCLRLHPFANANHRVFVVGILNFLLLQNDIGYCPLKDQRQFIGHSLDESLKAVREQLVFLNKESRSDFSFFKPPLTTGTQTEKTKTLPSNQPPSP